MSTRTIPLPLPSVEEQDEPPSAPAPSTRGRTSLTSALALLLLLLGVACGAAIAEPGNGRLSGPLALGLRLAVGHLAPLVPVALLVVGGWLLLRSVFGRPHLPVWRIAGAGVVLVCSLPVATYWSGDPAGAAPRAWSGLDGGLVGFWLITSLTDWLGTFLAVTLLVLLLVTGALLLADWSLADVFAALLRLSQWGRPWGHASVSAARRLTARWLRRAHAQARRLQRPRPPRSAAVVWKTASVRRAPAGLVARPLQPAGPPATAAPPAPPPVVVVSSTPEPAQPPAAPVPPPPSPSPSPQSPLPPPPSSSSSSSSPPVVGWVRPPPALLPASAPRPALPTETAERARVIEETLASFNVLARVTETRRGPTVTQFGIEPGDGVAVSRILSRQADLALRLGALSLRVEAPVPGRSVVGLEVPNEVVASVTVREVIDAAEWEAAKGPLRLALGRDVSGQAVVGDLGRMPHLLIAGATGAGKSVCLNAIIASLLYQLTPDELQLVMIDPKKVELSGFANVPHLRLPVITEMELAVGALKWVVQEMDRRYRLFAERGSRNLESFNRDGRHVAGLEADALPHLVIVVDELADLMMTTADEVEKALCRLAQLARATGIHLVVATQRPSVDVLTGLIKANFPTRLAFAVSSQTDSRVVLDTTGAEKLLGRGDALYLPTDAMKPVRLQGAFVSDEDLQALVAHWAAQAGPRFTSAEVEEVASLGKKEDADDDLYDRATEIAETMGRVSASLLQRKLGIGFMRAQRLRDRLIAEGLGDE